VLGYLKIMPKMKIDLTEFFDCADLGMNIEDWDEFERDFIPAEEYLGAIELMRDLKMDPNDCLAVEVMKRVGVHEIYTFDSGFDELKMIEKLP